MISPLQQTALVARREFVEYVRQPTFRNTTIVTVLIAVSWRSGR